MPAMLVVLIIFSGGWVDAYESCLPAGVELTRVYFGAALMVSSRCGLHIHTCV